MGLELSAAANIAHLAAGTGKPVYIGDHIPPHFEKVPHLMDLFLSFVHENWTVDELGDHPTALAAYALWRLNWIHPFVEGYGRTARAACYYLISLKQGKILTGRKMSRAHPRRSQTLLHALAAADKAWEADRIDVSVMANYLELLYWVS